MFVLSGFGFKPFKVEVPELLKVKEPTLVSFPQDESFLSNYQIAPPFLKIHLFLEIFTLKTFS